MRDDGKGGVKNFQNCVMLFMDDIFFFFFFLIVGVPRLATLLSTQPELGAIIIPGMDLTISIDHARFELTTL
jgi:hypothetical protein